MMSFFWINLLEYIKDSPVIEDNALGIYPNSVYLHMTSLAALLVLNSNNQN